MKSFIVVSVAGLAAVIVLALLAGLGYAIVQSAQQVTLPRPTGPHAVGRVLYDWTDASRIDPYAPGRGVHRELPVLVWYPAHHTTSAASASYLAQGWAAELGGDGPSALLRTPVANIHPHAVENVPVAHDRALYPVLVFAPGLGLAATDYTTLAEDLASHGYVVAGIDPTYSTDVVLSGDRVVRSVAAARDNADYGRLVSVWAQDMRFVAGRMRALDMAPGGRFFHRLDVARLGFFGHSAGGAAATLACRDYTPCAGAANLDGDPAGSVIQSGLGKPFLFLGDGQAFAREPYLKGMLRGVLRRVPADHSAILTISGAGHFNFSDRRLYFNAVLAVLSRSNTIAPVRALRITGVLVRAFFASSLQGKTTALLQGMASRYPEVRPVSLR